MKNERYMTAKEAATLLNVSEATLYAYVSRGLIRSEGISESSRQRRYIVEDVQKLADRKAQRRDPTIAAQDALHWGTPILESSITMITETRIFYRGRDVAALIAEHTFEDVAALIWTGHIDSVADLFSQDFIQHSPTFIVAELPLFQSMQIALAVESAHDLSAFDLSNGATARTGAHILHLLTAVLTQQQPLKQTIAASLAEHWSPGNEFLLNAALILCADHELNASSFTARVVASVEANPYAVVLAGLAALQGNKHGGYTERVTAFLREVEKPQQARAVIAERLRRGEGIPGFGHRLYLDGDPRAKLLLAKLRDSHANAPALILAEAVEREVYVVTQKPPTVDFALAVMEQVLGLPRGAALLIFALGRSVGWIGHAIEQYESDQIIRPRARYTGLPPR